MLCPVIAMTVRSPLATAAWLVIAFAASAAAVQCEPDCSASSPGDKVEDPRNCTQYYVCVDTNEPSDHPVACKPPTNVFDPVAHECAAGDSCEASCIAPACKLRCDAVLDVIADALDCSIYYYCDAAYNPGAAQYCPSERPYFDGKICTTDASVCCMVPCNPVCGAGDVQIPDPEDCTKYYVCVEEGTPAEDNHYTCDPGETFQTSSSMCVLGGACVTLCGGTTTTTTEATTTTTTAETTTTTTTAGTTTTATEPPPVCTPFLECPSPGYYPMCTTCEPGYFECVEQGANGIPMLCPDGYEFNTNPDYPACVRADECPYPSGSRYPSTS